MTGQAARALLSGALNVPPEDIGENTDIETCAAWDSMAHFRIVAAVEEALGRPLDPMEIAGMRGFSSVAKLLA